MRYENLAFTTVIALLLALGIGTVMALSNGPVGHAGRPLPTDANGWHSPRAGERTVVPETPAIASGELDPALQSLDGVTDHG